MREVWKDIRNYKGLYMVSNKGRIKSLDRFVKSAGDGLRLIKGRILKGDAGSGYIRVRLSKNGLTKVESVHRIVAKSFLVNPKSKLCVNHIDGNKLNNSVQNLEWVTYSENTIHAYENELRVSPFKGKKLGKHSQAKGVVQLDRDGELVKEWDCAMRAEIEGGFCSRAISRVCLGKRKHHSNHKWMHKKDYLKQGNKIG